MDISGASSRVFLLTLDITNILEQESLDISIFASADGATWGAKALIAFPQKFYRGAHPLLLDLSAHGEAKFMSRSLGSWTVGPWHHHAHVRISARHSEGSYSRGQAAPGVRDPRGGCSAAVFLALWLNRPSIRYIEVRNEKRLHRRVCPARGAEIPAFAR